MGVGVTRVAYVIRPGGDIVITFKADFAAAPATDGLYHHVDIHFISKHHIQRWIQRSRELPNMNRRGILHSCNDSLEAVLWNNQSESLDTSQSQNCARSSSPVTHCHKLVGIGRALGTSSIFLLIVCAPDTVGSIN